MSDQEEDLRAHSPDEHRDQGAFMQTEDSAAPADAAAGSSTSYVPSTFVKDSVTGMPTHTTSRSITLRLEDQDLAFVLGYQGQTKSKIARVSETKLDIDERTFSLTITGTNKQRMRAQEYTDMVLGQRRGIVSIDLSQSRDDLTVLRVPEDCVGYVTGRKGIALRNLELEWGTLMFFCTATNAESSNVTLPHSAATHPDVKTEILAIFGPKRGRLGAALKVMSAVDQKRKDYFLGAQGEYVGDLLAELDNPEEGFYYDQIILDEPDFRYALGTQGKTRKKLAKASGCILEYVGFAAVMIGTKEERERVKDYLKWLLLQRQNNSKRCEVDITNRTDVSVIELEAKYVGWVTGMKGRNLRVIEDETGVYLFCHNGNPLGQGGESHQVPSQTSNEKERILIFSHDKHSRDRAYDKIARSIYEKKEADAGRGRFHGDRYAGNNDGGRRGGDDRRGGGGQQRGGRGGRSRTPPPASSSARSPPRRSSRRDDSPPPRRSSRRESNSPPPRHRREDEYHRRDRDYRRDEPQQQSSSRRRSRDRR